MPDIVSLILLALAALMIIGPRRLPEGLEALWLALTDFQRAQRGEPPLGSLYNARRYWISTKSNIYAAIQILYQVTSHLQELRRRLFYVLIVFGIGFVLAFIFAQPLLGTIIQPVRIIQPPPPTNAPVSNYVLTTDVSITTTIITATGPMSATIILPRHTPLPVALGNTVPVVLNPTTLFMTYLKLALIVGIGLALPVILWQMLLFLRGPKYPYAAMSQEEWEKVRALLAPDELAEAERQRRDVYEGLTAQEIRPLYLFAPMALLLFLAGVLFTYFIILPNALDFLFGIGGNLVQALPSLDAYIDFALTLILWIGLAFELPLAMFFLARFGLITARQFAQQWRYAVVIIVVIAALITPTVDAFNLTLVAMPLIVLYLLGILFARMARPREKSVLVPAKAQGGPE